MRLSKSVDSETEAVAKVLLSRRAARASLLFIDTYTMDSDASLSASANSTACRLRERSSRNCLINVLAERHVSNVRHHVGVDLLSQRKPLEGVKRRRACQVVHLGRVYCQQHKQMPKDRGRGLRPGTSSADYRSESLPVNPQRK